MCNVSNQARSYKEDKTNRPWRPLPSGRISEPKAVVLRWTTVLLCVLLSFIYDQDLVPTTLCLVAVTYAYDELGGASNVVGKALCTAGGYVSFEVGATTIISMSHSVNGPCTSRMLTVDRRQPYFGFCVYHCRHNQRRPHFYGYTSARLS